MKRRSVRVAASLVVSAVLVVFATTPIEPPNVFSPNAIASARAVSENFESIEDEVDAIREFVIDVRRSQVQLRDRVLVLETTTLDPPPAPDPETAALPTVPIALASVEDEIVFNAGSLVDAADVNERFERSRKNLQNIDEFMQLLQVEVTSLKDRTAALEALLAPSETALVQRRAIDAVEALLPYTFQANTTMRSVHMNANFDALAATAAANRANAETIEVAQSSLEPRIAALEAMTSDSCEDLRPDRSVRVFDIDVDPPSPAALDFEEPVVVTFGYVNRYVELGYDGFRAWVVAYRDGEYALGTVFQGSAILTAEDGTLQRSFFAAALEPGESVHVNEAIVSIVGVQLDDEGEQVNAVSLLRCIVPVDVTFSRPE